MHSAAETGFPCMHSDVDHVARSLNSTKLEDGAIARCLLGGNDFSPKWFGSDFTKHPLPSGLCFKSLAQKNAFNYVQGHGPLVCLEGVPGFGKTWLMCALLVAECGQAPGKLPCVYLCQTNASLASALDDFCEMKSMLSS